MLVLLGFANGFVVIPAAARDSRRAWSVLRSGRLIVLAVEYETAACGKRVDLGGPAIETCHRPDPFGVRKRPSF